MDSKHIKWTTLAFMAFSTVWGSCPDYNQTIKRGQPEPTH